MAYLKFGVPKVLRVLKVLKVLKAIGGYKIIEFV